MGLSMTMDMGLGWSLSPFALMKGLMPFLLIKVAHVPIELAH